MLFLLMEKKGGDMAVITISKEFDTDAEKVASLVAEKLGYEIIGKRLVAEIAKELNISETEAETFHRASQSRILRFVDRYTCSIVQRVVDREHGCLNDENYFTVTRKLVEDVYTAGDVVILGWGSQCILKGRPGTLHVRLKKDADLKIESLMAAKNWSHKSAMDFLEREEGDLRTYIRQHFNEDWNAAHLYDLVVDMGRVSADKAAEMICDSLKHKIE